jgi:hypothetical protein
MRSRQVVYPHFAAAAESIYLQALQACRRNRPADLETRTSLSALPILQLPLA